MSHNFALGDTVDRQMFVLYNQQSLTQGFLG